MSPQLPTPAVPPAVNRSSSGKGAGARAQAPFPVADRVWLIAGGLGLLIGAVFTVSWFVGSPETLQLIGLRMKTNTAVCAVTLSIAVMLMPPGGSALRGAGARARHAGCLLFALLGGGLGALTLAQYLFGWNLGIDQLLAPGIVAEETRRFPNRMSPQAAAGFALLGAGLLLLRVKVRNHSLGMPFILANLALALMSLLGHGYQVALLYKVPDAIRISVDTSTHLLLSAIAVLARHPDAPPVSWGRGSGTGAVTARRLLPVALIAPTFLGFVAIRLSGDGPQQNPAFGISVLVLALVACFVAVILVNAHWLEGVDANRRRAEQALLEALSIRDEFLAVASHELKTPLTTMKLQLQLLKRRGGAAGSIDDERPVRAAEILERQLERLNRLVDDMLDVGRLNTGKMTMSFADVDAGELVREVIDRLRTSAEAAGSTLTLEGTLTGVAKWDRIRVEQVLSNLINNAVKYGRHRPITVTVDRMAGDVVSISVQDQGIGIAPEDLKRIFDRFARAVPAGAFGGLGLGLYISREIVEAHGGRLLAESSLGVGSRFTVHIPLRPAGAAVGDSLSQVRLADAG